MERGLPLIMTEKDAVKCHNLGLENAWFLAIEAVLPAAWEARFLETLDARLGRYSRIPQERAEP
jgi:tetraacyldisaccharide 4'-kinase